MLCSNGKGKLIIYLRFFLIYLLKKSQSKNLYLKKKGEAPTEEMERDWQRMIEAEERLKDKSIKHMV